MNLNLFVIKSNFFTDLYSLEYAHIPFLNFYLFIFFALIMSQVTILSPCIFRCTVCPHLWCCCIWHFNWFTNESRPPPTPKPRHACMLGNYWTIILIALFLIVVRWWTQHTPVCTLRCMQIHTHTHTQRPAPNPIFSASHCCCGETLFCLHTYSIVSILWPDAI